jgi:hypothetical protein
MAQTPEILTRFAPPRVIMAGRPEIKLEENLHRKNLTAYERSKTMVDLTATVKTRLKNTASTPAAQGPEGLINTVIDNPHGGPPTRPDALEKVAPEIGVSHSTLSLALHHVAAVERYPELAAADVSQREAIRLATKCEALDPQRRYRARKAWREAHRHAARARSSRRPMSWSGPA